ncbi:MAG TPA: class I tRNA ligase family protein, partial [Pseudomonadota bacterium]|nr:class I tRNA ligase family protein [Pseudomonadota bacterium]
MSATASGRFYLTTPIYYVSDIPHIGHAYTTIVGDAIARYERLRRGGENVFYLTGTDEHGEKLERAAQAKAMSPQSFVDLIAEEYKKTWQILEIQNDDFIRTTDPRHEKVVQELWRKLVDVGDIYLDRYEGLYCVGCENFLLEKDLLPGNLCPDHKRPVEKRSEESYFFRLSKYQQKLLDLYAQVPDFISPPRRMNEVRTFVESGLRDLSVSRSSFKWGVEVPGDPRHVIYVWIDALTNYYSALQDSPHKAAFWGTHDAPLAIHLVGKEIVRFHAV